MSKDIPPFALVAAAALSPDAWHRLKLLVSSISSVFSNDLKITAEGKKAKVASKMAVTAALDKIDKKQRDMIIDNLENKKLSDKEVRDNILVPLTENNIIRPDDRGKKRKPDAEEAKEEEKKPEEPQPAAQDVQQLPKPEEPETKTEEQLTNEFEEELNQKYAIDIKKMDVFKDVPTTEEIEKKKKEADKLRKEATQQATKAIKTITKKTFAEIKQRQKQQLPAKPLTAKQLLALQTEQQAALLRGQTQIQSNVTDIKESSATLLQYFDRSPIIKEIRKKIEKKITDKKRTYEGLGLDRDVIDQIASTVPEQNRERIRDAMLNMNRDVIDYNTLIAGMLGVASSMILNPMAGNVAQFLSNQIFNKYRININDYIAPPPDEDKKRSEYKEEDKERARDLAYAPDDQSLISSNESFTEGEAKAISDFDKEIEAQMGLTEAQKIKRKLEFLYNRLKDRAVRPTSQQITQGVSAGAIASAVAAGLSTRSAMGAVSGLTPGGIAGGLAGAAAPTVARITAPMVEQFFQRNGVTIDDNLRRKINYVSLIAPPALVGAYFGYTPPGGEVMGTGLISGAGITERKLIASPEVIQQTKAQETQEKSGNKIWQPKSISPSTDILQPSRQELYADDVEMIAQFDYIAPGTEGANGDLTTNLLKRSQATADAIRYTDAGVYIPYILWDRINDADTLTPARLDKLALGPELPPMDFMAQDNETTFENVAEFQYANGENTAIEFLSPYANFSNVDNFWALNPDSVLYTINP